MFKVLETKNVLFGVIITFMVLLATVISSGVAYGHSDEPADMAPMGAIEMKPAAGDTHHLEVKPETLEGYRIPYMKITVTATPADGGPVIEKELDTMFGSNFHYGTNIALEPKQYILKFHLDAPAFMREGKRVNQWLESVDAEFIFDAAAAPGGEIGTKETADMKVLFESEEAESMFVLPGYEGAHMGEAMHDDDATRTADNGSLALIGTLGLIVGFILGRFIFKPKLA